MGLRVAVLKTVSPKGRVGSSPTPSAFMSNKMEISINDYVKVRLTEHGKSIMIKKNLALPEEDDDGWSSWQLWWLFEVFSTYVGLGKTLPFETKIIISGV